MKIAGCLPLLFVVGCAAAPATDTRERLEPYAPEWLAPWQMQIVRDFAPVVVHGVYDTDRPTWDVPTVVDFDGNRLGADNEEHLRSGEHDVPAAVYYAFVETKTHYFVTYFFFHPFDSDAPLHWNWGWVGLLHENDGESVQVVVRKGKTPEADRVELLATQAHLGTCLYAARTQDVRARSDWEVEQVELLLVDGAGQGPGTHPALFIEGGGHGIYALPHERRDARTPLSAPDGLLLVPGDTDTAGERAESTGSTLRYRLVSLHDTLWASYREGRDMGDGKLFDGSFHYVDHGVSYPDLPRHFDSDRLSVLPILKWDAGIVPFAFSDSLGSDDLGAVFFDPAGKYARELELPAPWARDYVYNPYRP